MAPRRPASSSANASTKTIYGIRSTLLILAADPQLQGEVGAGAWRLSIDDLDQLLGNISSLSDTLRNPFWAVDDESDEPKPTGNPFWPLGWSPAQGVNLLQLAALIVRWPGYESWLPLTQLQSAASSASGSGSAAGAAPGATAGASLASGSGGPEGTSEAMNFKPAATTRQALVTRLRRLGLCTLQLVDQLLWMAPMGLSCRVACALLRTHTLHACSRGLARAVGRLKEAQAEECPSSDPDADPQASTNAGVAAAGGDASQADAADRAAARALAAKEGLAELHYIVKLSNMALEGICAVIGRLPRVQGDDTEDGVEEEGEGGSHQTGRGSGGSSSSAAGAASGSSGGRCTAAPRSWRAELVALLREALPGSGLVEHLARGVLHLLHSNDGSMGDIGDIYTTFIRSYMDLGSFLERSAELRAVAGSALGGRCASYLATAGGLQLLCTADGGPSYGMLYFTSDEDVVAYWRNVLPSSGSDSDDAGDVAGSGVRPGVVDRPLVSVFPLVAMACALLFGHAGRPAAVDLYVRLGNLAVAAAQHRHAARSGGGRAASSSGARQLLPAPELLLRGEDAGCLAPLVLRLMDLQVGALPERRRLAAGRRRWRLACEVVQGAMHRAREVSIESCAGALEVDLGELPADGTLSPQPPPALTAALSGGMLPCLERIVRRAGDVANRQSHIRTVPYSTEHRLLRSYVTGDGGMRRWGWLLAYGSPAEAAGLVLSWGKLLRVVAAEALPGEDGTLPSEMELPPMALVSTATTLACLGAWVMENADGAAVAAATATAAADGGPVRQLRRMAALAACEWLPVMSGFVLEAARRLLAPGPQRKALWSASHEHCTVTCVVLSCLDVLVDWLPVDEAAAPQAQGAGPSAQSVASTQDALAAGAEGVCLLQRVVREARAVELVGAGMRLVACCKRTGFSSSSAGEWLCSDASRYLLTAGCRLAMHTPGEVHRALAVRPAAGVPAHCTWSSEVVGMVARGMGEAGGDGGLLRMALESWEEGDEALLALLPTGDAAKAEAHAALGRGVLAQLATEVEQPCPLRRCSWWRCTNLAGDSEAGLPLRACARCGGAEYCGRECQVAHWRAGHKAECEGKG